MIEPFGHLGGEVFRVADHESEVAFGFGRFESGLMPLSKLR